MGRLVPELSLRLLLLPASLSQRLSSWLSPLSESPPSSACHKVGPSCVEDVYDAIAAGDVGFWAFECWTIISAWFPQVDGSLPCRFRHQYRWIERSMVCKNPSVTIDFGRRVVVPFLIICVRERNLSVLGLEPLSTPPFPLRIARDLRQRVRAHARSFLSSFTHTSFSLSTFSRSKTTLTMTGANKTRALVLIADGTEEMEAVITSMSTLSLLHLHSPTVFLTVRFFDSQLATT